MKKRLLFLGVALLCACALLAVLSLHPAKPAPAQDVRAQDLGMPVSVCPVRPGLHAARIKAFGEVVPLWQTTIKSMVEGKVHFLSDRLRVGNTVERGERLVRIEKSAFKMEAAEAKNRLAAAKVALLKEEREASQARRNWEQANIPGEPAFPLVWHKPQLEAARAEVAAAQAALARAQTLLRYTEIRAPFDGVIMQRMVNRGDTLFAGGEIATIYGMETVEVGVQLDEAQWTLLPETLAEADVRLFSLRTKASWRARVVRQGRHLDRDSRLRTLYLQVERPLEQTPPLLPGTFVRAEIAGRAIPGLLCLPEPALTKQGLVWFADRENRLRPRRLEPVFYGEGRVYMRAPADLEEPVRVAVAPNSSFIGGLRIIPVTDRGDDK